MSDRDSFLDTALAFSSRDARHAVADAFACALHNVGYQLEGNTESSDVRWFARNLYERPEPARRWELATEELQEEWCVIARRVISVLPDYQLRVAHRLIALSKVVRDIERAERKGVPASPSEG